MRVTVHLKVGFAVAIAAGFALSACSGTKNQTQTLPTVPLAAGNLQQKSASGNGADHRMSSSNDPNSFASQVGKDIGDGDIERFIDPSVTGEDRQLAHSFMKAMPKNMRGDFVYIRSDGTKLSNRPAFADAMVPSSSAIPPTVSAQSRAVRPMSWPPPTFIGHGAYIQEYSQLGVTSLDAYVQVDCNTTTFRKSTDAGYLMASGFGENAVLGQGGSEIDAGLLYNNDNSIQPYLRLGYTTGSPPSWTNQAQHYHCYDGRLIVWYGPLPAPSTQMVLVVGLDANSGTYGPTPPPQESAYDAAWVFFDRPSDYNDSGTDDTGLTTVCRYCTVTRLTALAMASDSDMFDFSSFGGCCTPVDAHIHWGPITMGQLVSPCSANGNFLSCSIQWVTSGNWFGGMRSYAASNTFAIHIASGSTRWTSSEGIYLDPTPAPTCTLDSYGYCAVQSSQSTDGTVSCFDGLHWHDYAATTTTMYDVFNADGYQETATETTTKYDGGDDGCPLVSYSWDPEEPSAQYSDPYLP